MMEKYCESCGRVFKDSDFKICPYCGNQLSERVGRQPIPRQLRHQVFQRDNYRCRECGATNKQTRLHVDHIVPVAKGGTNDLNNLQTLCETCNKAKYTDIWVGGEAKQIEEKSVNTTIPKNNIVKCICGFRYNSNLHISCPNCKKNAKQMLFANTGYDKYKYHKCPKCGALYKKNYDNCPYC